MDATIDVDAVPVLDGVRELLESGVVPGGTRRNRDWTADVVDAGERSEHERLLLADAQTSGGLLFGAAPGAAVDAVAALREQGLRAAVVGRVAAGTGLIRLT